MERGERGVFRAAGVKVLADLRCEGGGRRSGHDSVCRTSGE